MYFRPSGSSGRKYGLYAYKSVRYGNSVRSVYLGKYAAKNHAVDAHIGMPIGSPKPQPAPAPQPQTPAPSQTITPTYTPGSLERPSYNISTFKPAGRVIGGLPPEELPPTVGVSVGKTLPKIEPSSQIPEALLYSKEKIPEGYKLVGGELRKGKLTWSDQLENLMSGYTSEGRPKEGSEYTPPTPTPLKPQQEYKRVGGEWRKGKLTLTDQLENVMSGYTPTGLKPEKKQKPSTTEPAINEEETAELLALSKAKSLSAEDVKRYKILYSKYTEEQKRTAARRPGFGFDKETRQTPAPKHQVSEVARSDLPPDARNLYDLMAKVLVKEHKIGETIQSLLSSREGILDEEDRLLKQREESTGKDVAEKKEAISKYVDNLIKRYNISDKERGSYETADQVVDAITNIISASGQPLKEYAELNSVITKIPKMSPADRQKVIDKYDIKLKKNVSPAKIVSKIQTALDSRRAEAQTKVLTRFGRAKIRSGEEQTLLEGIKRDTKELQTLFEELKDSQKNDEGVGAKVDSKSEEIQKLNQRILEKNREREQLMADFKVANRNLELKGFKFTQD